MLHIHAATAEDPLPKTYARPSSVGCWFGLGSRFDWVQRPSVRPAESPSLSVCRVWDCFAPSEEGIFETTSDASESTFAPTLTHLTVRNRTSRRP